MKRIIGRHRVRANFYHFVSILYVITMALWFTGWMGGGFATWFGFFLFVIDYLAQMYDPHPDQPGFWFKRHFHRFLDDNSEKEDDQ